MRKVKKIEQHSKEISKFKSGVQELFYGVRAVLTYLNAKRYTTLAGASAYFFFISLVPFLFWLTILFGKWNIDFERLLNFEFFAQIKEFVLYLQQSAKNATGGASIFLLLTTMYSSTNLFYHMRRSGEIIYDWQKEKGSFVIRLSAILLIFVTMLFLIVGTIAFLFISSILESILPSFIARVALYLLFAVFIFALVLLLNLYICPYRVKILDMLWGTAITVFLGSMLSFGFSIYTTFSNLQKLYGAAVLFVLFLLYIYLIFMCFIIGVALNCYLLEHRNKKLLLDKKF